MQDAYPIVTEISDEAREVLAKQAERSAKNFRNLAKLRVDLYADTYKEEPVLDEEGKPVFKKVVKGGKERYVAQTKKRRISKEEWALTWNAGLNAQASRMEHLKDQMLRTYEIGEDHVQQEETNVQMGEAGAVGEAAEPRVHTQRPRLSGGAIAKASRAARNALGKQTS